MKATFLILTRIIFIGCLVLAMLTLSNAPQAFAAGTWYVATTGDDVSGCLSPASPCRTLNGAICKAASGDSILVAAGTYTTTTGSEVVLLNKDLTLSGGWDESFTTAAGQSVIDAENQRGGMKVDVLSSATISRFLIQNARYLYAGINVVHGYVTIENSTFTGNHAWAIYIDNSDAVIKNILIQSNDSIGIYISSAMVELIDSTIAEGGTGIVCALSTLVMGNSLILENHGSGIDSHYCNLYIGKSIIRGNDRSGMLLSESTARISASAIIGNTYYGGKGGGINHDSDTLAIDNSTISGNHADYGGGIYTSGLGGLISRSNTISMNSARYKGGGMFVPNGGAHLHNTLLAGNSSDYLGADCFVEAGQSISSGGYNLIGKNAECIFTPGPGDLINLNPQMAALNDYGGGTFTHALLSGSPAIDAADPTFCIDNKGNPLVIDQRGLPRLGRCDIGAYEWQPGETPPYIFYFPFLFNSCSNLLYFDDFSNPGSGWQISENPETRFEYLNGEYRILVKAKGWWAAARPGFKATDFVAVVDVSNASGKPGRYGIIFGLSDDWNYFYTFEIDSSGNYFVSRKVPYTWTELASGASTSINTGTAVNQLKVEREGGWIWVYANGQLLTVVSDNLNLGMYNLGLSARSSWYDENLDIRFDNFTIYPVRCEPANAKLDHLLEAGALQAGETSPYQNWKSLPRGSEMGW